MDEQPANVLWSTASDRAEVCGDMYPWVWLLPRVRSPIPLGGVTWSSWIGSCPRCRSPCLPDVSRFGVCSKCHCSRETRTVVLGGPTPHTPWVTRVAQVGCSSSVSHAFPLHMPWTQLTAPCSFPHPVSFSPICTHEDRECGENKEPADGGGLKRFHQCCRGTWRHDRCGNPLSSLSFTCNISKFPSAK